MESKRAVCIIVGIAAATGVLLDAGAAAACSPGSHDPGTGCTACPAGTYSPMGTACLTCSAGSYAAAGSSSCSTCSAGSYATAGSGSCTPCALGTYQPY